MSCYLSYEKLCELSPNKLCSKRKNRIKLIIDDNYIIKKTKNYLKNYSIILIQIPRERVRTGRSYWQTYFDLEATVCGVKTGSKTVYARERNQHKVFIQTDKGIYKPGQKGMNDFFLYRHDTNFCSHSN